MNAPAALSREVSAERQEVIAMARELGRRELAPQAGQLDEGGVEAREVAWGQVREVGFDRALLDPEDGGAGLDTGSLLLCLEALAAGEAGVALLVLLANAAWLALPSELAAEIGEGERWALLPAPPEAVVTGTRIATHGKATKLKLSGEIAPAFGALGADGVVILGPGPQPALAALSGDAPELSIEPFEHLLGLRSAAAARVSLDRVPAHAPAVSLDAIYMLLRAGSAAIARGVARRAQALALEYAQTRIQGGVPIIEHDAVRRMLAGMSVSLAANPILPAVNAGAGAVLAAKVAATDAAMSVALDAVQVFGGAGYMYETGAEKLMRDARYLQLWPEPNWLADAAIVEGEIGV